VFILSLRFVEAGQFKYVLISFHDDIKGQKVSETMREGDNLPRRDHSAPSWVCWVLMTNRSVLVRLPDQ